MNRNALFVVGILAIVLIVSRLPDDVFATTRAVLVLAAGVLLIALALGIFLRPARAALAKLFTFRVPPGPAFAVAEEKEWRELLKPLLGALALVAVAGLASVVRSLV